MEVLARRRRAGLVLVFLGAAALSACNVDLFGTPPRTSTHGYRAVVTIRDATSKSSFAIAVRGDDRRKGPVEGEAGKVLILKGKQRKAYELDPAANTWAEAPFTPLDAQLTGRPLVAGFDDHAEAMRRGSKEYHRESDTVFSGRACRLFRYEDRPGDIASPSTTYWVAPDLDMLVVRVDREEPGPGGAKAWRTVELTNVFVGANPSLFEVPSGYRKTAGPPAP